MISYKLAQEIVSQTMLRLHHNINVMNLDGTIIASGDATRIEDYHPASHEVIKTKKPVIIDEKNMNLYPNTKQGINMPIFFQEEIVCIIGITGKPSELQEIAQLIQLTAEVIINQALLESQFDWQRKIRVNIFNELIDGQEIKGVLKERIQKLPFPIAAPFTVIRIKAQHKMASHRTLTQYLEDYFQDKPVLYGHHYEDSYFILMLQKNLAEVELTVSSLYDYIKKHFHVQIGLGKTVEQVAFIPTSYKTASIALQEASQQTPIVFYNQIELKTLFDQHTTTQYGEQLLHNLSAKLIETLEVLFQSDLHLALAAETLQIHRHTLTYRLEKITSLTSLNPLHFQDAMKLQIALWFHQNKTA